MAQRAVLQKPTFLTNGDVFQFYGELSADGNPELAQHWALSVTPIPKRIWTLTGSFGAAAEACGSRSRQ